MGVTIIVDIIRLFALSKIGCHVCRDILREACEAIAHIACSWRKYGVLIATRTGFHYKILNIDGADSVAEQLRIVLIKNTIRLAVTCTKTLCRSSPEVPEGGSVKIDIR